MSRNKLAQDPPRIPAVAVKETARGKIARPGLEVVKTPAPSRSLAEDALRVSEARYRRLFEAAQDGILILNAKTGAITDVNPFLLKLLDSPREHFLGKALWQIGLFKDIRASRAAFRELQIKKYVRYENLPLKTSLGKPINVEFVSNVYEVYGVEVIQCNIRDITKRRQTEESNEYLRQAHKMEAIGQLAGGVAHDFNNLLGIILGYCEAAEAVTDLPDPVRKMIVEIHNAGTSAKDLTRHLLAFSRRQVLQPVALDLNAIVDRVKTMLGRLIGEDVELVNVLSKDLWTIKVDPIQVEQVLMNLAVNARQAMPHGGKISIKTANVTIEKTSSSMPPGRYVMLSVTDNGLGMDKKTQARVFEPFFSGKESGEGTGLGLSTVFSIIKQSGGTIDVHSEPPSGTTFTIHFPRCVEKTVPAEAEEQTALRGGIETILLVEDAAPLRELTCRLLEDLGYTVLASGDPAEAVRIAMAYPGPLPLMITDVMMPGFSGLVLAEKLAVTRPEMRVLYTSGYADDLVVRSGVHGPDEAFLEKPFTRDSFVRKVRQLLDRSLLPSAGEGELRNA